MKINAYYKQMEGAVFKLLPLYEEQQEGHDVHLDVYIYDLYEDLVGAQELFPELAESGEYISILQNVKYLMSHDCDLATWKRRVMNSVKTFNELRGVHHV